MLAQVETLKQNAEQFEAKAKALLSEDKLDKNKLKAINQELRNLEKAFIDPKGMAYGSWYRSLYASSDPYSGYASWMLPAFQYEASLKSTANLADIEARHAKAIENLNNKIVSLNQQLGGTASSLGGGKN